MHIGLKEVAVVGGAGVAALFVYSNLAVACTGGAAPGSSRANGGIAGLGLAVGGLGLTVAAKSSEPLTQLAGVAFGAAGLTLGLPMVYATYKSMYPTKQAAGANAPGQSGALRLAAMQSSRVNSAMPASQARSWARR